MEVTTLDGELPEYDVIYVSPHLDDAVYSCAAHIQSQVQSGKRVLVLTLFTGGPDSATSLKASLSCYLNLETRREEDVSAMEALGADFHHMQLQEALIRHGGGRCWLWGPLEVAWIWVAGCFRAEKKLQADIVQTLQSIIAKTHCSWLIGPAGIGLHPDHLVAHRACVAVREKVNQLWHYYDFPYCTYQVLTWQRRLSLDVRHPLLDVDVELNAEQIASRKNLLATYGSQVEAIFGSKEKLESALEKWPHEHFMEERRSLDDNDRALLPLPSMARRSKAAATAVLKQVLLVDILISVLALFWVRHGLDWPSDQQHALKFAYAVIGLSWFRVFCLAADSSFKLTWWLCVSSIICTAAAFSYTAEVRSIVLAFYYSIQMWLGCAEQSIFNFAKKKLQGSREGQMKVLVVSDYMPPQTHGISTHTKGIVTALRETGCFVNIYTTTCPKPDGATFLTWSVRNPWNPDVRLSLLPSLRLIWTILCGNWDVVHIIYPNFLSWPVMLSAWLAGAPIYTSQHCNLELLGTVYVGKVLFYISTLGYCIWTYIPLFLFTTLNAVPTRGYAREHPVMSKFSHERQAVVPSSVDDTMFHSRGRAEDRLALLRQLGLGEGHTVWLVVSRLAPEKDIEEILYALKLHREHFPEDQPPVLVIAGDGPLRSKLEELVRAEGLPVYFLGFKRTAEVAGLYRACDVCATNSIHETFGLTVIEALSSGSPVVMPHCGVFDELYKDPLDCWMYEKGNLESLVTALRAASQPSARDDLSRLRANGSFSKSLFWSWKEAAVEQVAQYRQAQDMVQERKVRRIRKLKNGMIALSVLTLVIACTVLALSTLTSVHNFISVRGGRFMRGECDMTLKCLL